MIHGIDVGHQTVEQVSLAKTGKGAGERGESFCQNQTRSRVSTRKVASWLTTRSPQRLAVRTMEKKRTPPQGQCS